MASQRFERSDADRDSSVPDLRSPPQSRGPGLLKRLLTWLGQTSTASRERKEPPTASERAFPTEDDQSALEEQGTLDEETMQRLGLGPIVVNSCNEAVTEQSTECLGTDLTDERTTAQDEHVNWTEVTQVDPWSDSFDAILDRVLSWAQSGRRSDALKAIDEAVRRYGDDPGLDMVMGVAIVLDQKSQILKEQGRNEEAIQTCDEVMRRYGKQEEPALLGMVADALNRKGAILAEMGRFEESLPVFEMVDRQFGHRDEANLAVEVAMAMANKALNLLQLGRCEEVVATVDLMEQRFGLSDKPQTVEDTAKSKCIKMDALTRLGRLEEALVVCDELWQEYARHENPEIAANAAQGLFSKGMILGQLRGEEAALSSLRELESVLGHREELPVAEIVARGLLSQLSILSKLGRDDEVIQLSDAAAERYWKREELPLAECALLAFRHKLLMYMKNGNWADAMGLGQALMNHFPHRSDPSLQKTLSEIREMLDDVYRGAFSAFEAHAAAVETDAAADAESAAGDGASIRRIASHVRRYVGPPKNVFHEYLSHLVHIDVHVVSPSDDRPYYTLVTSGMSDRPMDAPPIPEAIEYAELMLCLPPDWRLGPETFQDERYYWPIRMLKFLARYPHEKNTWFGCDHTIGGDEGGAANRESLSAALLTIPSLFENEFSVLSMGSQKRVHFLAVIPLYPIEVQYSLEQGKEALKTALRRMGVNELLNVDRPAVC